MKSSKNETWRKGKERTGEEIKEGRRGKGEERKEEEKALALDSLEWDDRNASQASYL